MAERILIIDDDENIRQALEDYLAEHGYDIATRPDGLNLSEDIKSARPDLIILDLKLPGKSGMDILRELRTQNNIPVLILTGLQDEVDMVLGLEIGGDDYISKPFSPREVLARVRALIRRSSISSIKDRIAGAQEGQVKSRALRLDPHRQQIEFKGRGIKLSPVEFRLMQVFMENAGRAVSRVSVMSKVFEDDASSRNRKIDVHVNKLRAKLEKLTGMREWIKTDWGTGYIFTEID